MVGYRSLISRPQRLAGSMLVAAVFLATAAHGQTLVAVDDTFAVPHADTLLVEAPGVLDNDTFNGGTAEDAGAVIDLVISGVTHGTLILNSDGSFSYDPFADFPGVDSFTYQASVGAETGQATVTLSACDTGPTVFTCWMEGPYLAKLGELGYGTFQEGFESDATWGSVREPSTALSVVSQGIAWQTNHPDPPASNKITTGDGAARSGLWGIYDPDHGYATGTPEGCNVPTPECLFKDGFTGTRQSGASTLYGAGGFFSGTHGANLALILDGGAPIGLGKITVGTEQFFGVIDTTGFTTFRFEETDGKVGQSRLVFADDFSFGTTPADTTPPQVSLINSVSDTGDGILSEGEVTAAAITQLLVNFDELVSDEGGETAPHSVTNLANYLLFSDGGDGFDTVDCATGVDVSDSAVAVDWVTYASGSERTAILDINGGSALSTGDYRLLVCGTTSIKDWAGNSLDGDGNGTGGDDFARNFTVTGPPGYLQFSSVAYSVAENGTSATITVTRTGGSFGAATVGYATGDLTATAGADYTAAAGTLSWVDGEVASKTFQVPISDDSTYEGDETVSLTLSGAVGATLGFPSSAVLTITEDDPTPPAGSIQFSLAAYSVAENGTQAVITVTRTGGDFGAASVNYATSNGSATAGSDYTSASGTINFDDGDAVSKTFNVPITDDSTWEGDETVNLSLTTPVGATLGAPSSAVLTITEDDPGNWFVAPTGSDAADCTSVATPCLTIGEAVFRSASGDSIQVASGTYSETLALSKSLTLNGTGVNPVIDGSGFGVVVGVLAGTTVTMSNFEIRNGSIGGVENAGNLTLIECWIYSNGDGSAATFGGVSTSGIGRIERSTVSGNFGDTSGGIANSGQLDVVNSTIQGNAAAYAQGIYNPAGATLDLQYSTVAENGAYGIRGGGTVRAEASIIALHGTANCEAAITTLGYNLEDGFTCGLSAPAHDLIGVNPMLGVLAAAGGPTPTMALSAGSPAIDAGGSTGGPAIDQRGVGRPIDGDEDGTPTCDIGAFEFQAVPIFTDDLRVGGHLSLVRRRAIVAMERFGSWWSPVAQDSTLEAQNFS